MTLHADALAVLRAWEPPTPTQAGLRDRYLSHLTSRTDAMSRDCYPDHITASTLVLSADLERVLLTLHAKAGRWFQFGGHCEPSDLTLVGAAAREAREESGIDDLALWPVPAQLSEHEVRFCDPRGGVHHLDVRFVAVAHESVAHAVSDESLDVRWWPADRLPDPDPDLVELVGLARAQSTSSPGGRSSWAAADHPVR